MQTPFEIRPAESADVAQIMQFVRDLAEYEREPDAVIATEGDLTRELFGESPRVFAVLCWDGETPIGFALYFYNFSTWLGRQGLYLEDLYVDPAHRGRGAGKQLLSHLAQVAAREGCGRFEWSVLNWNKPAIDFYESLGARPQSEWSTYRITGEALASLANGS